MKRTMLTMTLLCLTVALACAQPPEWQLNSAAAWMDLDNVVAGGPFGPKALTQTCLNGGATLTVNSTHLGNPYEVVAVPASLVPGSGGGFLTANGQVVNVDLSDPGLIFLNSGDHLPLLLPFPGPFILPLASTSVVTVSGQMVIADPTHLDGFALSQGVELEVTGPGSMPGPSGDDSTLMVEFSSHPLCGPATVPFFGTSYTRFWVNSNGTVSFGGGDTGWTPTVSEALARDPFIGYWADLSPNAGGNITVTSLGLQMRVDWNNVPYFSEPGTSVSFGFEICSACGAVNLDGLTGIGPNPAAAGSEGDSIFFGISPGAVGAATDPGATAFAVGAGGTPALPTDMMYDFHDAPLHGGPALPGSLVPGTMDRILFVPVGNGYSWTGL